MPYRLKPSDPSVIQVQQGDTWRDRYEHENEDRARVQLYALMRNVNHKGDVTMTSKGQIQAAMKMGYYKGRGTAELERLEVYLKKMDNTLWKLSRQVKGGRLPLDKFHAIMDRQTKGLLRLWRSSSRRIPWDYDVSAGSGRQLLQKQLGEIYNAVKRLTMVKYDPQQIQKVSYEIEGAIQGVR